MSKKTNNVTPTTSPKVPVATPKLPTPHSVPPKAEPQNHVPPTSKLPPPKK